MRNFSRFSVCIPFSQAAFLSVEAMSHPGVTHSDITLPAPKSEKARGGSILEKLKGVLPTILVVAVLGSLGAWGHHSDWTLPKFSTLVGNTSVPEVVWCEEHGVPEAQCIECNKELWPAKKSSGWCMEHGVADCPLHHPDVAELKTAASVTKLDFERAERGLALKPRPENNSRCLTHEKRIQFASVKSIEKAGIDIAIAVNRPVVETITANGEVVYDARHMAELSSRVAGTVRSVEREVGDRVKEGEVLAYIDAAEVGKAKAELLQGVSLLKLRMAASERLTNLAAGGSIAGRQAREAETDLEESRIQVLAAEQLLSNLGLPVDVGNLLKLSSDELAEKIRSLGLPDTSVSDSQAVLSKSSNIFPLRSPLDGIVVSRKVVAGETVDGAAAIFQIANTSQMWLELSVRQADVAFLSLGQRVSFTPKGGQGSDDFQGTISWISTEVDDRTRTVPVRVNLSNKTGKLRANTFGTGSIVLREEEASVVIPDEAIHWDGCCHVVFVRDKAFHQKDAPKFFHIRKVRLGARQGDSTEILVGLLPGEVVASANSSILEAQLLKGNLGAGCGCADGH